MKKFTKGSLMIAGGFAVIGLICLIIAGIFGGRSIWYDIREANFTHGYSYTSRLTINGEELKENQFFQDTISAAEVEALDLTVGIGEFTIVERDDNEDIFELVVNGRGEVDYGVKDKTLYVEGFENYNKRYKVNWFAFSEDFDWGNNQITLYVPRNKGYQDVELNIGAGSVDIIKLKADRIISEVGAGELAVTDFTANELSVSVGVGHAEFSEAHVKDLKMDIGVGESNFYGKVDGDMDISSNIGSTQLELDQAENDFNYDVYCGVGNVEIARYYYNGLGASKYIDNDARQECTVNCSIGNVTIHFND